jgi:hypothetical protein
MEEPENPEQNQAAANNTAQSSSGANTFTYAAEQPVAQKISHEPLLKWRASEFIHHQKSVSWFLPLVVVSIALAALTYFIGGGVIGVIMVISGATAFAVTAKQEPDTLEYALFPQSIAVGTKEFSYDDFKTFSVAQSGGLFHVVLNPIRRFLPPVTIYFPKEEGAQIFDILADHLPSVEERSDPIDNLMQKIRF